MASVGRGYRREQPFAFDTYGLQDFIVCSSQRKRLQAVGPACVVSRGNCAKLLRDTAVVRGA